MKVFLSGAIRGDEDYRAKFDQAEKHLKDLGYTVMNPAHLSQGFDHEEYMHIRYCMIDICDAVVQLPDWKTSEGARAEAEHAALRMRTGHSKEILSYADIMSSRYVKGLKELIRTVKTHADDDRSNYRLYHEALEWAVDMLGG